MKQHRPADGVGPDLAGAVRTVVVVGAGVAGVATVTSLRDRGYDGTIRVVSEERHEPYDRPPLSKEILVGEASQPRPLAPWDTLDVDWLPGCTAVGLTGTAVQTSQGDIEYDRLVIATGCRPVRIAGMEEHPSAHVVRTLDDAVALRAELRPGRRVVIVGAGWIGAEVASSAASLGCRVAVVESQASVLPGAVSAAISDSMLGWYDAAGVELVTGRRVVAARPGSVRLDDDTELAADVLVVGVGVVPNTEWLAGSGMARDPVGAVVVDEHLRTSVERVFAAGDCAAYRSSRYGGHVRVEHWTNAQDAGATVAANILGLRQPHDPVPYFWSRQFDRMVQYLGRHHASDQLVWRGGQGDPRWSACWVRGGRLTGVIAVNRPRDIVHARPVLEGQGLVDLTRLGDPSVSLADCTL